MANDKNFAKELNDLITRYIRSGSDPWAIVDELTREANLVFAGQPQNLSGGAGREEARRLNSSR
jgi:hypothetical protein